MENRELVEKLESAKREMDSAIFRQAGKTAAIERFKNLLLNYHTAIIDAVKEADALAKKVTALTEDVASLEASLDEADNEIKELKATAKPKGKSNGGSKT